MSRKIVGRISGYAVMISVAGMAVPSVAWVAGIVVIALLLFLSVVVFAPRETPFNRLRALIRDITRQSTPGIEQTQYSSIADQRHEQAAKKITPSAATEPRPGR